MTGVSWGRAKAAFAMMALVAGAIAYACADGGYEGGWEAKTSSAILSPANDTRTNLLLLLADRQGTATAHPAAMAKGIVPIEFPWRVAKGRLAPPPDKEEDRWKAYFAGVREGTRCQSNAAGAADFIAAVRSAKEIPAAEADLLVSARQNMRPSCDAPDGTPSMPVPLISPAAKEFSTYLVGADEFYRGEFESARSRFMSLTQASSDWIRETSLYMVARNELNRAQLVSFDEYGSLAEPEKRDRHTIQAAEDAFDAYLQAYPKGRYASSAAGLLRRVAWLKGDQQALGNAYSALLRGAAAKHGGNPDVSLIEEIDLKLLPAHETSGVTDPVLLAVIDLVRLRKPMAGGEYAYGYGDDAPQLERAELERQRPLFKSEPALFDYLLASEALYGRKQPREVLALIPDAAHQKDFTYVQFSRQMLRGFALEAVKDPNARGFWLSLLPGATRPYQRAAVELALAEHDGAAGAVERLLTAHSPVRHPLIRQRMVEEEAGPALLRQLARSGATTHEREVSLYLLLAGELHHGLYADFLKDSAMVGARPVRAEGYYGGWEAFNYDPFDADELGAPPLHVFAPGGSSDLHPCPDIRATAASLAVNLSAIRPQLCLAEFIRRKGFDHWNVSYDAQYRPLTRPRNGFPGQPLERINIYKTVIASSAASPDDKAFALNRAVRCFAPSGSSSCGGDDIPVAQRKAWFTQLKRDYPQSSWAKDLKHYW